MLESECSRPLDLLDQGRVVERGVAVHKQPNALAAVDELGRRSVRRGRAVQAVRIDPAVAGGVQKLARGVAEQSRERIAKPGLPVRPGELDDDLREPRLT